jgi:hypothetical protein
MSERIQRRERAYAEARRRREQNARERAEACRKRGDYVMARIHESAADLQRDAAIQSEEILAADRKIEGDQLGK